LFKNETELNNFVDSHLFDKILTFNGFNVLHFSLIGRIEKWTKILFMRHLFYSGYCCRY